jgi:hypothetical protein
MQLHTPLNPRIAHEFADTLDVFFEQTRISDALLVFTKCHPSLVFLVDAPFLPSPVVTEVIFFVFIRLGRVTKTWIVVYGGSRPAAHADQIIVRRADVFYLFFQGILSGTFGPLAGCKRSAPHEWTSRARLTSIAPISPEVELNSQLKTNSRWFFVMPSLLHKGDSISQSSDKGRVNLTSISATALL